MDGQSLCVFEAKKNWEISADPTARPDMKDVRKCTGCLGVNTLSGLACGGIKYFSIRGAYHRVFSYDAVA